jgi:transposase-like protein
MLAKIRRMHLRDKLSIREIARRTDLSRNTVRKWLRLPEMEEPRYPLRQSTSIVDAYAEQLRLWLQTDSHRAQRDRRTARVMFEAIKGRRLYWQLCQSLCHGAQTAAGND